MEWKINYFILFFFILFKMRADGFIMLQISLIKMGFTRSRSLDEYDKVRDGGGEHGGEGAPLHAEEVHAGEGLHLLHPGYGVLHLHHLPGYAAFVPSYFRAQKSLDFQGPPIQRPSK